MADESPNVSVIIPAYNAAEFIGETLDSVYAQTFTDFEVIVVNDGSPDTEELERNLTAYSPKLRYLKQENQGAAAARNTGIKAARGEFVAFLDADDMWLPAFLEKQVDLLRRTQADVVWADALISGDSPLAGRTFMEVQPSVGEVTPENLLSVKVTVLTSTVVARRQPILDVGLFDVTLRRGQDFELWLKLARHGCRFVHQEEVLAHRRIVESSLSGSILSQLQRTLTVLDAIEAKGNLTPSEEAALQVNLRRTRRELALETGKEKLLGRDFRAALHCFQEARKFRQSWKLVLVCLGLRTAPELLWRIYHRRAITPSRDGN
jgi:glycosyltransferase involved in cell wall biosynthesis